MCASTDSPSVRCLYVTGLLQAPSASSWMTPLAGPVGAACHPVPAHRCSRSASPDAVDNAAGRPRGGSDVTGAARVRLMSWPLSWRLWVWGTGYLREYPRSLAHVCGDGGHLLPPARWHAASRIRADSDRRAPAVFAMVNVLRLFDVVTSWSPACASGLPSVADPQSWLGFSHPQRCAGINVSRSAVKCGGLTVQR